MVFINRAYCLPRQTPLLSQNLVLQAVHAPAASLVQVKQFTLSSHPEEKQGIEPSAVCCVYNNIDVT